MKQLSIAKALALGVISISLSACNGVMGGIYDEPDTTIVSDFGFISSGDAGQFGVVYIDATSYTRWTYIDFSEQRIDTLEVGDAEPANWDIAVHRYDVKTNGAAVMETGYTGFDALLAGGLPDGEMVKDEWTSDRIAVDMSGMMDGYIEYQESYYNTELSKWLDVDTSTMPPIYTLSKKVYLVKLQDGTYLAVRLANFMNDASVKGYMTIQYKYAIEF